MKRVVSRAHEFRVFAFLIINSSTFEIVDYATRFAVLSCRAGKMTGNGLPESSRLKYYGRHGLTRKRSTLFTVDRFARRRHHTFVSIGYLAKPVGRRTGKQADGVRLWLLLEGQGTIDKSGLSALYIVRKPKPLVSSAP
ncbi:MAG: hypothetical protein QOJ99_2781 [Bryobacterales bacterium]|nr:hypothetical protein [Bryobacterales bacterium]